MTEQEKLRCPNERPLYLYIQGHTKHSVDCTYCLPFFNILILSIWILNRYFILTVAIQKINEIIKTEHQSSLNRPSRFTNAPPPLMSLHSGVTSVVSNVFYSYLIYNYNTFSYVLLTDVCNLLGKDLRWYRECTTRFWFTRANTRCRWCKFNLY